jgi:UDP-4-amino-4-deoxy-L-arabinose formyltransferase/UDP-glucuronic acid dehydrogenase (UDP-4-keto-hexauronic acid decarboxylating)
MKVALLGRTHFLLNAGEALAAAGHRIVLVGTAPPSEFYSAGKREFEVLAERHGASFFAGRLHDDGNMSLISDAEADIAVSMNWPTIISARTMTKFSHGILNAHAGDLPRYRGNACPNWAIINGESRVGLCVHSMDPDSLDSGPILCRRYLPLDAETYIGDVYDWLETAIPQMFVEAVDLIASGRAKPEPQPTAISKSLRCFPRRPEDSRIQWSASADSVLRMVRASSTPFAGAFAYLEGERLVRIWRASGVTIPYAFNAIPGQVIGNEAAGVSIACGEGAILLTKASYDDGQEAIGDIGSSLRNRLM